MEKNYISIDRAQTDELIETLSFLQLEVLATLRNDTKDLSNLLNETTIIKNEISTSETNITNNLKILEKILEKIEVSETTSEIRIININNKFQKEIQNLKNEIIKEVENNVKNINLVKLEKATSNSNKAIRKLIHFYRMTKIIHLKNNILTAILSFMGGGALASLLFYFIF